MEYEQTYDDGAVYPDDGNYEDVGGYDEAEDYGDVEYGDDMNATMRSKTLSTMSSTNTFRSELSGPPPLRSAGTMNSSFRSRSSGAIGGEDGRSDAGTETTSSEEKDASIFTFHNLVIVPFFGLLDSLVGLLANVLLACSCILPWRFIEIAAIIEEFEEQGQTMYRKFAFFSFMLTLVDFVAIPLGLLSLMSPRTLIHIFVGYIWLRKLDNRFAMTHVSMWSMRVGMFQSFVGALRDVASIPFLLVALLIPTRTYIVFSETVSVFMRFVEYQGNLAHLLSHWCDYDDWMEVWNEFDRLWVDQGTGAIVDVLCIVPAFFSVIFIPSLYYPFYSALSKVVSEHRPDTDSSTNSAAATDAAVVPASPGPKSKRRSLVKEWNSLLFLVRVIFLMQPLHGIVDIVVILCAVLALLSPMRNSTFRSDFGRVYKEIQTRHPGLKFSLSTFRVAVKESLRPDGELPTPKKGETENPWLARKAKARRRRLKEGGEDEPGMSVGSMIEANRSALGGLLKKSSSGLGRKEREGDADSIPDDDSSTQEDLLAQYMPPTSRRSSRGARSVTSEVSMPESGEVINKRKSLKRSDSKRSSFKKLQLSELGARKVKKQVSANSAISGGAGDGSDSSDGWDDEDSDDDDFIDLEAERIYNENLLAENMDILEEQKELLRKNRGAFGEDKEDKEDGPEQKESILLKYSRYHRGMTALKTLFSRNAAPTDFAYCYDIQTRFLCLSYGSNALFDFLLLPFLLPLLLTYYRTVPLKHAKLFVPCLWSIKQFKTLLKHIILFYVDVLFAPFVFILYVTRIRWFPVGAVIAISNLSLSDSVIVYKCILTGIRLLTCDVLSTPIVVFLLMTSYRSRQIKDAWRSSSLWHTGEISGLGGHYVHIAAVYNFLILLHDIFLLLPLVLLVLGTIYRAGALLDIIRTIRFPWSYDPDKAARKAKKREKKEKALGGDVGEISDAKSEISNPHVSLSPVAQRRLQGVDSANLSSLVTTDLMLDHVPGEDVITVEADEDDETGAGGLTIAERRQKRKEMERNLVWRQNLWLEILGFLLDLPFAALGMFVFATVWRAGKLYGMMVHVKHKHDKMQLDRQLAAEHYNEHRNDANIHHVAANTNMFNQFLTQEEKLTYEWERRLPAGVQFYRLVMDFIALFPFGLVVATLYRLPGMMVEMIKRDPDIENRPLLVVTNAQVVFPERGGVRMVLTIMKRSILLKAMELQNPGILASGVGRSADVREHELQELAALLRDAIPQQLHAQLHIEANDMVWWLLIEKSFKWRMLTKIIGIKRTTAMLKVLAGSVLLPDRTHIGLAELCTQLRAQGFKENNDELELWLQLDLGSDPGKRKKGADKPTDTPTQSWRDWFKNLGFTIRRDLIKLLKELPQDQVVGFQLEVPKYLATAAVHTGSLDAIASSKVITVLRFAPTIGELYGAATVGSSMLVEGALDVDGSRFAVASAVHFDDLYHAKKRRELEHDSGADHIKATSSIFGDKLSSSLGSDDMMDLFADLSWKYGRKIVQDTLTISLIGVMCMAPWRVVELVRCMYKPRSFRQLELIEECFEMMHIADEYLYEFKRRLVPLLNNAAKECVVERLRTKEHYSHSPQMFPIIDQSFLPGTRLERKLYKLESTYLESYRHISGLSRDTLQSHMVYNDVLQLYEVRLRLQDCYLRHCIYKSVAHPEFHDGEQLADKYGLVIALISESSDNFNDAIMHCKDDIYGGLIDLRRNLLEQLGHGQTQHGEGEEVPKHDVENDSVVSNAVHFKRLLLELAYQSVMDILFICGLVFLLCSIVYTKSVLKELKNASERKQRRAFENPAIYGDPPKVKSLVEKLVGFRPLSIGDYGCRRIIWEHLTLAGENCFLGLKLIGYTILNAMLFVTFPSYIAALPARLVPLSDAVDCAKEHFSDALVFLHHFVGSQSQPKLVKTLTRALLYTTMMPAALFAEINPWMNMPEHAKYLLGVIIWFGLAFVTVVCTMVISVAPPDRDTISTAWLCVLVVNMTVVAILVRASYSLDERDWYRFPAPVSLINSATSWSHILAFMIGPVEALQMCGIFIYMFWTEHSRETGLWNESLLMLHTSYLNSNMMAKLKEQMPSSNSSLMLAVGLASLMVFVWGVTSAVPVVFHGDPETRRGKIAKFATSPVFGFIHIVCTQLMSVFIMFTLLRPYTCTYYGLMGEAVSATNSVGKITQYNGFAVYLGLATNGDIPCGGHPGLSTFCLAFLVYYMLTSSLLHPSLVQLMDPATSMESDGTPLYTGERVRIAPFYTLVMKMLQFMMLVLTSAAFDVYDATLPLTLILACAVIMTFFSHYFRGEACNIPGIVSLRTCGAMMVLWTSFLCLGRRWTKLPAEPVWWANMGVLYTGLVVIACYGGWMFLKDQYKHEKLLREHYHDLGVEHVIETLEDATDAVIDEMALLPTKVNRFLADDAGVLLDVSTQVKNHHHYKTYNRFRTSMKPRGDETLNGEAKTASIYAKLLVEFEEEVRVDRLSYAFLSEREKWRGSLQNIHRLMDSVSFESYQTIIASSKKLTESVRAPPVTTQLLTFVLQITNPNDHKLLPRPCVWHIFSFLVDGDELRSLLQPMLTKVRPLPYCIAMESRGRIGNSNSNLGGNSCFVQSYLLQARVDLLALMSAVNKAGIFCPEFPVIEEPEYFDGEYDEYGNPIYGDDYDEYEDGEYYYEDEGMDKEGQKAYDFDGLGIDYVDGDGDGGYEYYDEGEEGEYYDQDDYGGKVVDGEYEYDDEGEEEYEYADEDEYAKGEYEEGEYEEGEVEYEEGDEYAKDEYAEYEEGEEEYEEGEEGEEEYEEGEEGEEEYEEGEEGEEEYEEGEGDYEEGEEGEEEYEEGEEGGDEYKKELLAQQDMYSIAEGEEEEGEEDGDDY